MQVTVLKEKNGKFTNLFEGIVLNIKQIVLLGFLILGVLAGVLSVKYLKSPFIDMLNSWFEAFIQFRAQADFFDLFFKSFLLSFVCSIGLVFASFGASGVLILPFFVFFRGFGTAAVSGFLYRNFSLQGIAFADLILLPSVLAFDMIFLLLSTEGLELSLGFFKALKNGFADCESMKSTGVNIFKKLLFFTVTAVLISVFEAAFCVCFIKFFSFG